MLYFLPMMPPVLRPWLASFSCFNYCSSIHLWMATVAQPERFFNAGFISNWATLNALRPG